MIWLEGCLKFSLKFSLKCSLNSVVNWQANTFTEIILNIMSNFTKREIVPREPPWFTKPLKYMLNRKNRLFKNYKRYGYREDDKLRLLKMKSCPI